jgi:hypothetical protein
MEKQVEEEEERDDAGRTEVVPVMMVEAMLTISMEGSTATTFASSGPNTVLADLHPSARVHTHTEREDRKKERERE